MQTYGFKVHLKVMLAPANYCFLCQEQLFCLFIARKKLHNAPLMLAVAGGPVGVSYIWLYQ